MLIEVVLVLEKNGELGLGREKRALGLQVVLEKIGSVGGKEKKVQEGYN